MEGRAHCATTPFAQGLGNNRAGRILANHLAAVEASATTGGYHGSAASETCINERVFVHAIGAWVYGKRARPCGLPTPLPRFIAILNLSGERMMVYSDQPELITSLCRHSSALRADELAERLRAFERYTAAAPANVNRFVLLTYSMPWQVGPDAAFWHLNACNLTMGEGETPRLADRVLTFSGTSAVCFKGKPVLDPRDKHIDVAPGQPQFDLLTLKQIEDFEEAYSATCLDHADPPPKLVDVSGERMVGIMKELTRGRAKDQAEIRDLKTELLAMRGTLSCVVNTTEHNQKDALNGHHMQLTKLRNEHDEKLLLSKKEHAALRAEMAGMQDALNKSASAKSREIKAHDKYQAKFEEVKRQSESKDKLHNAALSKHRAEIVSLEARLETATSRAATLKEGLDKEHAALVVGQQTLHTATLDKANAAVLSKERLLNQLSENNERLSVAALSLKSHDAEQAATIARLEKELAALVLSGEEVALQSKHASTSTSTSTRTRNASTATHHCASTQTGPDTADGAPPEAVSTTNLHVQAYQGAVDLLQELVATTRRNGRPALQTGYTNGGGYPMPLPYPHFTPHPSHAPPPPLRNHSNYTYNKHIS